MDGSFPEESMNKWKLTGYPHDIGNLPILIVDDDSPQLLMFD